MMMETASLPSHYHQGYMLNHLHVVVSELQNKDRMYYFLWRFEVIWISSVWNLTIKQIVSLMTCNILAFGFSSVSFSWYSKSMPKYSSSSRAVSLKNLCKISLLIQWKTMKLDLIFKNLKFYPAKYVIREMSWYSRVSTVINLRHMCTVSMVCKNTGSSMCITHVIW